MRCAMEAVMVASVNRVKIEEAKAREIEAMKIKIATTTARFVEEIISPILETQIAKGETPTARIELAKEWEPKTGRYVFDTLIDEGNRQAYANGDRSYRASREWFVDEKLLTSILAEYCYTVTLEESTYKRYGWGTRYGVKLIIEPAPMCI